MKVSGALALVIFFATLLLPHSLFSESDTVQVELRLSLSPCDCYKFAGNAEVWVNSNTAIKGFSIAFAANPNCVSIDSAYILPYYDNDSIFSYVQYATDSIFMNNDVLTFFQLGMLSFGPQTLFPINEPILIGECKWRYKVEPIFGNTSFIDGFNFDSIFIPPAGDFVFSNGMGETIRNISFKNDTIPLMFMPEDICGDANCDAGVSIEDAIVIINYVFLGGHTFRQLLFTDVNCDMRINISDAVWIINYLYTDGPAPCDCP